MGETWSVLEAENIARKVHAPQTRWDKSPYIKHPEAVVKLILHEHAMNSELPAMQCVAWMHDVIEDSKDPQMEKKLRRQFPARIVDAIKAMSRNKKEKENYFDFIMRVKHNRLAAEVKIADITHNLSDLKEGSMKDKYRLARFILKRSLVSQLHMRPS